MEEIRSLQNEQVKRWTKLHQKKERDRQGRFLIEGEHLLQEAYESGIVETVISLSPRQEDVKNVLVTRQVMDKIAGSVSGTSVMAVCRITEKEIRQYERILLLDNVQDPGNLGTMIRSAVSFCFDGVILSDDCCDVYNDKTVRSTQGALFRIPVIRKPLAEAIRELKEKGVRIAALAPAASDPMAEMQEAEKMGFILGNEGNGIRKEILDMADQRVRIEMDGFESLNVAVAGGIIMYRFQKHSG